MYIIRGGICYSCMHLVKLPFDEAVLTPSTYLIDLTNIAHFEGRNTFIGWNGLPGQDSRVARVKEGLTHTLETLLTHLKHGGRLQVATVTAQLQVNRSKVKS